MAATSRRETTHEVTKLRAAGELLARFLYPLFSLNQGWSLSLNLLLLSYSCPAFVPRAHPNPTPPPSPRQVSPVAAFFGPWQPGDRKSISSRVL